MSSMEKIVHRQLERWTLEAKARQEALEGRHEPPAAAAPWVCIGRQYGAGGSTVARKLAARLNYRFFDRELIEAMAGQSERRIESLKLLDEKVHSAITLYIEGLLHGEALMRSDYLRPLMEIVLAIGAHGAAVILGRGAHLILDPTGGLSVRLVAPFEYRVRATAARLGITEEKSREQVSEIDHAREEFTQNFFQKESNDPVCYDLVLNTARVDVDSALGLIEEALREKTDAPTAPGGA